MDHSQGPERVDAGRRHFFGAASILAAAAQIGAVATKRARAAADPPPANGADAGHPSANLKQLDAGALNVGYAEAGPASGPVVILLHGWPYDIHSFGEVAPVLSSAGYRVIVPYLRGYGTTRFLSGQTVRNGQQSVIAVDIIALMDALDIRKAIIGGFDWGARTANIIAALWPELASGSGGGGAAL